MYKWLYDAPFKGIHKIYNILKEEGTVFVTFVSIILFISSIFTHNILMSTFIVTLILILYSNSRYFLSFKDKNLIAYFPLKNNLLDINPEKGNAIPLYINPNDLIINNNGIKFNKNMCAIAYIPSLPIGNDERSIICWFRFDPDFDISKASAHFICAFGSAKKAGRAFGIYYGSPQISGFHNDKKGLRLFLYSTLDNKEIGDSQAFYSDEIKVGKWYYVGCSYDGNNKITIVAGDKTKNFVHQEIKIQINTSDSKLLYIGQIPSEIGILSFNDGGKYFVLPVSKWNFCGYIRELTIFNKYMSHSEMQKFANLLKKKL